MTCKSVSKLTREVPALGPFLGAGAIAALVLSACTAEIVGHPSVDPAVVPGAGGSAGEPGSGVATDLPCGVQALLRESCQSCHQAESLIPLVSHADLTAPSAGDPSVTRAQAAVLRMAATDQTRMPPSPTPRPPGTEVDAFSSWVDRGAPLETCAAELPPSPPDPYATPVVCTSSSFWTGGDEESPRMNPGQACISCHTEEDEGPDLAVAGTLYPTAHEPDDCNGTVGPAGTYVEVTDAAGRVFELRPNAAGNFLLEDPDAFALPYTAKVVSGDQERVMVAAQDSGDCNGCHTESGASQAPGRILLP